MATIKICNLTSVLNTFDVNSIIHINVHKYFNVAQATQNLSADITIHSNNLGKVAKSGRILVVYCKATNAQKCSMYLYNADNVNIVPSV